MPGTGTDVYSGWTHSGGHRVWVRVPAEMKRRANGNGGPMRPGERWWRTSEHHALNGHGEVEAAAEPTPILLVHPVGMSSRAMVPLLRALGDRDVFAPDLPGFGMSDPPPKPLGIPGLAQALRRWMIDNQVAPATVVAFSLGCQVAVELAARNPALVERLVLVSPPLPAAAKNPRRLGRRIARAAVRSSPRLGPTLVWDRIDALPWRVRREQRLALAYDLEMHLGEIEAPTLVIRGDHDKLVPPETTTKIARAVPRAQTAELQGGRHMPSSGSAERLAGLVSSFLDEDPPSAEETGDAAEPRRRWFVDGMNLIGSRPDGWWRDREKAWRRLHRELEDHARSTGDDVHLFLDGRRPRDWHEDGLVETAFASGGRNAADDALAARVAAEPHPEAVRVVTNDRELAERVRERGAKVSSTGAFRKALERGASRS
jgi:pimeloyl-ACP methyl ester carboxylesterase